MLEGHISLPTTARSGHSTFPISHSTLQAPLPKDQQYSSRSLAGNDTRADNGLSLTERFTYVPPEHSKIANAKPNKNLQKARQLNKIFVTSQLPSENTSHTRVNTNLESRTIRRSTRVKRVSSAMSTLQKRKKNALTPEAEVPLKSSNARMGVKAMNLKRTVIPISSGDSDSTLSEDGPVRHAKVPRCDTGNYSFTGDRLSAGRESMGRAGYAIKNLSEERIGATLQDRPRALEKAESAIAEVLKKVELANATPRKTGGHDTQNICVKNKNRASAEAIALYAKMMKHLGGKADISKPTFEKASHERINTTIKQIEESAQPPSDRALFPGRLRNFSPSTAIPNAPKPVSNPVGHVPATTAATTIPFITIPNMPQSGFSNPVGYVSPATTTTLPSTATPNMPQSEIRNSFSRPQSEIRNFGPVFPTTTTTIPAQISQTRTSQMQPCPAQPSQMKDSQMQTSDTHSSDTPPFETQPVQTKVSQAHIYAQTILRIYHPASNATYVPVKLRSCMTIPHLFTTAAKAWDIPVEKIAALIIRSSSDTVKNMRIKMEVPDSFECFVDMVEKMWDAQKGEIKIHIDIEVKG
ncbi:MAG: hypothetical protein Q9212_007270 [Teloschistes hypoglaucus]